jgi:hypothetical protein
MKHVTKAALGAAIVAILIGCAVPAVAAAGNWTDKGVELTENRSIPLSGSWSFSGSLGGVSCSTVAAEIELEAGSTGKKKKFSPTLSSCKTTGGLAGCSISSLATENLPWGIHRFIPRTFTRMKFRISLVGFLCPATITLTDSETTMASYTPDSESATTKITLGGELEASVGGNVKIGGEFTPTNASDSGTYGL